MNNKGSQFGLKGFQLKNIIEQYNAKFPEKAIQGYKKKSIADLDNLIMKKRIKKKQYNIIENNPYSSNIFKKAGITQHNTDEQNLFLEELEKNERYLNPLQALSKYTNKEGTQEYLTPQEHQMKFVSQFIYSSLRGAIMFHGVGSGKTLTAVISSYYYLKMYPNNKVIVISPSALLFNFVAGMVQYGLNKNDNRYSFYTYDKYNRNPKVAKDSLLIVDEAHNFRTEMKFREVKDPSNPNTVMEEEAITNKKGYKIMKWGSSYCHKILLLTGTAFVNVLYDIENLLAMIDNRKPTDKDVYDDILDKVENTKDYFDYKISYYKNSEKNDFFPDRREKIMPIYMTEEQEKNYNKFKNEGNPLSMSTKPNSFYSAEKYASNMIDNDKNPKTDFIVKEIIAKPKQKFIIYSGLYNTGIMNIVKALEKLKIKFKMITGKQNTTQKEESKFYFNFYNFKNTNFFDTDTIDKQYHRFINDEYRVLLITRAGAEGVDTINCQNIILLDGQWNDALAEQIIARAIRYKSHFGLPKAERYVNVIKCLFCFQSNKKIIEDINKGNFDFRALKKQISDSNAEQLKLMKGSDKRYLPTIKELEKLKVNDKLFIPAITEFKTIKGMYGRKSKSVQTSPDGWDIYKTIATDEKRKEWRRTMYYKWIESTNKKANNIQATYSIDLYLYILSKSKQATIDEFISYFGGGIYMYEKYKSSIMKRIIEKEKQLKRTLTEKEKMEVLTKAKKTELNEILKFDNKLMMSKKTTRNSKNQLQQFYTNSILADYLFQFSGLKSNKNDEIKILEPSAGEGDLIKPILKNNTNISIDLVEIDPKNRKLLSIFVKNRPNYLKMTEQPNFLLYQTSTRYDYIFMNPPFHLRKAEDNNLIRDTWDFDFIKRAFAFLKIDGVLMAVVSKKFLNDKDFMDWTEEKNKIFEYEIRKNEKFSGIKIDIAVLKITKINDNEDTDLMSKNYYIKQDVKGKEIMNNERKIAFDDNEKFLI
jgi:tRNA1(Val) A37 N6-methylase TrmN6/superfamily II DNA or RNA helicase